MDSMVVARLIKVWLSVSPFPLLAPETRLVLNVQLKVVCGTEEKKAAKALCPEQMLGCGTTGTTSGVGFRVIWKVSGCPAQLLAEGVTMKVATKGAGPL